MFGLTKTHLSQLKAAVKNFGTCWFHADGNIYVTEKDSDFRKNFSNPKDEKATYRVKVSDVKDVPETVEGMNQILLKSRQQEIIEAARPAKVDGTKTFTVEEEEPENPSGNGQQNPPPAGGSGVDSPKLSDEEALQKMIEEEEAAKK